MNDPRHGRRISSLSVTYQEEFRKPVLAGLPETPAAACSAARTCVPRDQTLEDVYEEFQGPSDIQELGAPSSFYPSRKDCIIPALLPPASTAVAYNWPAENPLYGLEDSLRQKINVQIESFRASVQQTICQEFDLHRHSAAAPAIPGRPPLPSSDTGVNYYQDNVVPSAELQQRSGYYEDGDQNDAECDQLLCDYSPEESAERSNSSTCTVDSGIEELDTHSLEQQIDQCLIRLQTYASLITNTLRRTEYST